MGPRRQRALREDGTLPVTPPHSPVLLSHEQGGCRAGVEGLSGLGWVNVLSVLFWGWGWPGAFKALRGGVVTQSWHLRGRTYWSR